MKLTIMICSLQKRLNQLALLAEHLQKQAEGKPVEILWLGDNKTMSVGEKRNKLLAMAKGDYVCYVDDDDWVADDYVESVLQGIANKPDCVCFDAIYTADEAPPRPSPLWRGSGFKYSPNGEDLGGVSILVKYSLNNLLNVDEPGKPRLRVPNHLIPIKREYALATMFAEKNFGEDTDYGLRVRRLLKTEYKIEKPLYYYRFSVANSETHKYSPRYRRPISQPMVKMDVVIVSNATLPSEGGKEKPQGYRHCEERSNLSINDETATSAKPELAVTNNQPLIPYSLYHTTQTAINSIASPNVNIIVLEKANNITYANADTFLQKEPFNYNQCLNDGASMGNAEYICFANNDVVFPDGFVEEVIREMQAPPKPHKVRHCEERSPSERHLGRAGNLISNDETATPAKPELAVTGVGLDVLSVTNHKGFIHPHIISGFCFIMRRDAWLKIGKLNTDYSFWCADNVTSEQIKQHKLREGRSAIKVFHGTSVTLNKLNSATRDAYTKGCVKQFNRDYNSNVLGLGAN